MPRGSKITGPNLFGNIQNIVSSTSETRCATVASREFDPLLTLHFSLPSTPSSATSADMYRRRRNYRPLQELHHSTDVPSPFDLKISSSNLAELIITRHDHDFTISPQYHPKQRGLPVNVEWVELGCAMINWKETRRPLLVNANESTCHRLIHRLSETFAYHCSAYGVIPQVSL